MIIALHGNNCMETNILQVNVAAQIYVESTVEVRISYIGGNVKQRLAMYVSRTTNCLLKNTLLLTSSYYLAF